MNIPRSIRLKCREFRALFSSDKGMGDSLGMSAKHARELATGHDLPSLDAMIVIQEALMGRRRDPKKRPD